MARRYNRDRRGRFASVGATARGGRLTNLKGKNYATVTKRGPASSPAGTLKPGKRKPASSPASGIRPTGGLRRVQPANKIVSAKRSQKPPIGLKANAVRSYRPATRAGAEAAFVRRVSRTVKDAKSEVKTWKRAKTGAGDILRKLGRMDAKTWAARSQKGIKGDMARIESSQFTGRMIKGARETIQRRAQRAADVAGRGRKAGAKALNIYNQQLAFTGKGKPKAAKNAIKPGPRNTTGPKRKPRKRKPKK